ncbi:MAG: FAD-dependent oxidoreductase [Cellvibrionaceae bacterium]|nr:FAD-dependent oxidoreductase [Cellvibrionaceae bacterium]
MREQLLIIGNGMATGRLLDELIKRDAQRQYSITVIGEEPYGNYNRIMLSSVLANELAREAVMQKDTAWFSEHGVSFVCGVRAEEINRVQKQVHLANGKVIEYDHLVLATGSRAATIAADNPQLPNIFSFRGLQDVESIGESACRGNTALVVGGGFLGLEAAYGLAKRGLQVVVVHRGARLLNRQLDQQAANFLQQTIQDMGIKCYLNSEVKAFTGRRQLMGVELKSGERIDCQLAVLAAGITPNKELAEHCGLLCGRAICVDDFMQSSDEFVSALGECVEHKGMTFGLVEPIWQMCNVLADRLCDIGTGGFVNKPIATKLKISGVDMLSAGEVVTRAQHRELRVVDFLNKSYRKILLKEDIVVGTVLFGDTRSGGEYFQLMTQKINVAPVAPQLIFGSSHFDISSLTQANLNGENLPT